MAGFAASSCIRAAAISKRSKLHGNEITAGVGVKLKEVAYAAKAAGLGGLEWMEGIPGEVGGGLRMNAGAMGAQTFDNVVRIRYLDGEGEAHEKTPSELEVHYRHVPSLEQELCGLGGVSRRAGAAEEIVRRLDESQKKRRTIAAGGEKCRLHFQESAKLSGRKIGRRTWPEKSARRQSARLECPRQFHRQRWRRDRGRDSGVDREDQDDRADEARNRVAKPRCKSWGNRRECAPR